MKTFWIATLLMVAGIQTYACDVCGCSATGRTLSLWPKGARSFAGVRYEYRHFTSVHESLFGQEPETSSDEYFHTWTIWGQWRINNAWSLMAHVPIHAYRQVSKSGTFDTHGVGDLSLQINYQIWEQMDSTHSWSHQLSGGLGVKAPTGAYDLIDLSEVVIPNMQPGTGSWDVFAFLNYVGRVEKWGIQAQSSFQYNGVNSFGYQFGQRIVAELKGFRELPISKRESVYPFVSVRNDWATKDMIEVDAGELNAFTGGNFLQGSAGLQWSTQWGQLAFTGAVPIWQNFGSGSIELNARFSTELVFFIP
ncbi:hypothetical protein [Pontibacter sp. G13]|uniref:hypothetical protein n=1 Tax=Pontibacter sp. G13 TaxID=3074898 RepID=UPI00288957EE|nr:hypothetical protein [Pontibacter sp. G13]WNJ18665.1 hypothetical protein RJD25_27735 [Pontibacter sp. G13]